MYIYTFFINCMIYFKKVIDEMHWINYYNIDS